MPPRAVSALTVMQLLVIFLGVLFTGLFMKLPGWQGLWWPQPMLPNLVRHYGFWLCLLPLVWAVGTTILIRPVDNLPQVPSAALIAGYILLVLLAVLLGISGFIAASWGTTIRGPIMQAPLQDS